MKKVCFTCSKEFKDYRLKKRVNTFCGQKCYWEFLKSKPAPSKAFKKGHLPWNTGTKGVVKVWNKGISYHALEKHNLWKGENVGYTALHKWVRKQGGIPTYCSKDATHDAKRFVWANKSGEYKRDLSDWHTLCNSCNLTDGISVNNQFINKKLRRLNYA